MHMVQNKKNAWADKKAFFSDMWLFSVYNL